MSRPLPLRSIRRTTGAPARRPGLFLPFTVWALTREVSAGLLTGWQVAALLVAGVLLHLPVAALFVLPYRRGEARV